MTTATTRRPNVDNDEFQCEKCRRVMDVENSVRLPDDDLICEDCNRVEVAKAIAPDNSAVVLAMANAHAELKRQQPPKAATPRPWTVSSGLFEKGSDYPAEREANIRLAVRCVNVHDKLIEALKACQTWLNQESCQHGDAEDGLLPPGPQSCLNCEVNEALKLARGE